MTVLSWKHHTLIQALIARGPLKEKEFQSIFAGVTGKNPGFHGNNKQVFDDYLLAINKELSQVHFELRACRDQYDGQVCYGVVNTIADEQSKLGTKYSVPQIAFYKGIIEAIAQDVTAQGTISNIKALNIRLETQMLNGSESQFQSNPPDIPPALRNFTMSQKEKTIDELVQDKWLCSTDDHKIGLGIRSLLDLRSWFRNTDVPSCQVCNEAGIKAELCQTEGCMVRIHQYCLRKMVSQKIREKICPGCGNQWPYQAPEGEAIEEDEPGEPSQSQPAAGHRRNEGNEGSRRKKSRMRGTSDADMIETISQPSQTTGRTSDLRRVTRSSSRLR